MDWFLTLVELVGTVAFSVSGAATAIGKRMDIFGVCILGIITAVGGGIIRDLMIGSTPPQCFQSPLYLVVACLAAAVFFLPFIRKPLQRRQAGFDRVLFTMDTLGLAAFTVVGIQAALQVNSRFGWLLLLCEGVLTGTGGGVLRDLLAGDMPYIFRKHVYATASLAGAVLYLLLHQLAGMHIATVASMLLICLIRVLSARFRWNLPHASDGAS